MICGLRQFPNIAKYKSVLAIEIRQASLASQIVLIVECLLAKGRVTVKAEGTGTQAIPRRVN